MAKYRFFIMQGKIKRYGTGDYWEVDSASTLKEAKRIFNSTKRDIIGFDLSPYEYLDTGIAKRTFQ